MNKFVELPLELNFHANWHLALLFTIIFDSIYRCTFISAFWISSGMLCISTDCSRMFSDLFIQFESVVVEAFLFWVVGVGDVLAWLRTVLEAATMIPIINTAFTNKSVRHVLAFLKLWREDVCISVQSPSQQTLSIIGLSSIYCSSTNHSMIIHTVRKIHHRHQRTTTKNSVTLSANHSTSFRILYCSGVVAGGWRRGRGVGSGL